MWIHHYTLIIDEVSIGKLDMLLNITKQLVKARGLIGKSIAMFGGLSIVILIGDFYQFSSVIGRLLWD